jgi:hypothetical protein
MGHELAGVLLEHRRSDAIDGITGRERHRDGGHIGEALIFFAHERDLQRRPSLRSKEGPACLAISLGVMIALR